MALAGGGRSSWARTDSRRPGMPTRRSWNAASPVTRTPVARAALSDHSGHLAAVRPIAPTAENERLVDGGIL
jgi:hypothetical protein